jgi:nitrogen fixation protein FixH
MSSAMTQAGPVSAWRSPWVIGWIAMVVIVLGVNLAMVYFAISSNPGLVSENYYERGEHYEHTLVSKLMHEPNWLMRGDIPKDIKAGETRPVRFFVVDSAGQPVDAERVTFHAYRPSDAKKDFSAPMREEGKGRYVAEIRFPLYGVWDTLFSVTTNGTEYNKGQRIQVLRP